MASEATKSGERRQVRLGACELSDDIRLSLPERLDVVCARGETVEFILLGSFREQSRDRELVRVVVASDLPGSRAALFDFTDRPGIRDARTFSLPHRFAAHGPGKVGGALRVSAERVVQEWESHDVVAWHRAERVVPVTVTVS